MSSGDKLRALSAKKASIDIDRDNYAAYVAGMVEFGGWSEDDVTEYRNAVGSVMKNGTDDEKLAAKEFWALKAAENISTAPGINVRIRAANDEKLKDVA